MKNRIIQALILATFMVLSLFISKDMEEKKTQEVGKKSNNSLTCEELCLSAGFGDLVDKIDDDLEKIYNK